MEIDREAFKLGFRDGLYKWAGISQSKNSQSTLRFGDTIPVDYIKGTRNDTPARGVSSDTQRTVLAKILGEMKAKSAAFIKAHPNVKLDTGIGRSAIPDTSTKIDTKASAAKILKILHNIKKKQIIYEKNHPSTKSNKPEFSPTPVSSYRPDTATLNRLKGLLSAE